MHLVLKREHKEDYFRGGEASRGLDYGLVNRIMCSFEAGFSFEGFENRHFKGVLTSMHRKRTGLA